MTIDNIIDRKKYLDARLHRALSTMEKKDDGLLMRIKNDIIENQKNCPHVSEKYNWESKNGICPYCGARI